MKEKFKVTGMTCSACSSRVEKTVSKLEGTDQVSVNLLTGTMQVSYDDNLIDDGKIIEAVEKAGYGASLDSGDAPSTTGKAEAEEASKAAFDEAKQMKHRLIWSVVLLVPLMYVSMGHMLTGKHMPDQPLTMVLLQVVFLIPIVVLNKKYFLKGFPSLFEEALIGQLDRHGVSRRRLSMASLLFSG